MTNGRNQWEMRRIVGAEKWWERRKKSPLHPHGREQDLLRSHITHPDGQKAATTVALFLLQQLLLWVI